MTKMLAQLSVLKWNDLYMNTKIQVRGTEAKTIHIEYAPYVTLGTHAFT